jgi:hypothetical protein
MKMKICSGCERKRQKRSFHNNKSKKDGLSTYCKECSKSYMGQYIFNNKEKLNTYGFNYYYNKKRNGI